MSLFRIFFCSIILIFVVSSCEQKPLYKKKQSTKSKNLTKKISGELSDAADYATGAMPLKALENSKKTINDISEKENREIKKTIETKD
jgi:hypothetical protein